MQEEETTEQSHVRIKEIGAGAVAQWYSPWIEDVSGITLKIRETTLNLIKKANIFSIILYVSHMRKTKVSGSH